MKITREFIEQHRTAKGGFTFAQCRALGSGWPPEKGWMKRAVQIEHTEQAIAMFVQFKERAKTKQDRRQQRKERNAALQQELGKNSPRVLERKLEAAKTAPKYGPPKPVKQTRPTRQSAYVNSDDFLSSYEWRRVRMVALKKYGAQCQCCGASPETGAVMNVDHIKPRRLFPTLALDVDNLQVLCGDCNHGKGNWDMTDWRPAESDRLAEDAAAHLRSIMRER